MGKQPTNCEQVHLHLACSLLYLQCFSLRVLLSTNGHLEYRGLLVVHKHMEVTTSDTIRQCKEQKEHVLSAYDNADDILGFEGKQHKWPASNHLWKPNTGM